MSMTLRADVSLADTGTGLVLLDERTGRYWQLNGTGAFVLHQLLDGRAEAEVSALVRQRYVVDDDRAARDVGALVERLRGAGLLAGRS